jgi:hypothetical protein
MNQKAMVLDQEVSRLRDKYGEVDEVTLYDQMRELHLQPEQVEIVYKSLASDIVLFITNLLIIFLYNSPQNIYGKIG